MSTDPTFRMTVQDVFFIRDAGTVVTGQVESGLLKVGDEVIIQRQDSTKKAVVSGIEMLRKRLQQAQAGDNVGLLMPKLVKQDVQRGDVLVGSAAEFD